MKWEGVMDLTKVVATAGSTGAVATPVFHMFTSYIQQPVWGIPVTVFGAAAFGAGLSLFFGDPIPTRKALFGQVLASAFFGAGAAVMAADAMDWAWAEKNISMSAMMSSAVIRWFLPSVIDRGKLMIAELKFSFTKNSKGDDK